MTRIKHHASKNKNKKEKKNEEHKNLNNNNLLSLTPGNIAAIVISVLILITGIILLILYFTGVLGNSTNSLSPIQTLTTAPQRPTHNPTHTPTRPITLKPNTSTPGPVCPSPETTISWISNPQNFVNPNNLTFFNSPALTNGFDNYFIAGQVGFTTQVIVPITYSPETRQFSNNTVTSFNWVAPVTNSTIASMFSYGSNGLGVVLKESPSPPSFVLNVRGFDKDTGAVDTSFGVNGLLELDAGDSNVNGYDHEGLSTPYLESGNKHIITGNFVTAGGTIFTPCIWRINNNGTMDTSFGVNGIFKMPSVPVGDYGFTGISGFGKAVEVVLFSSPLIGYIYFPFVIADNAATSKRFGFVACVTLNGTLNTSVGPLSFNNGLGYIELGQMPDDVAVAMPPSIVLSNDSLFVAYSDCPSGAIINSSVTIAKYTLGGQLVTSFGNNGKVSLVFSGNITFVAPQISLLNLNNLNGTLVVSCIYYDYGPANEFFTKIYKLAPDTGLIEIVADIKVDDSQKSATPGQTVSPDAIQTNTLTLIPLLSISAAPSIGAFGTSATGQAVNSRPVAASICIS